jgi:hypothetical protein
MVIDRSSFFGNEAATTVDLKIIGKSLGFLKTELPADRKTEAL